MGNEAKENKTEQLAQETEQSAVESAQTDKKPVKFTKAQLLGSNRYSNRKDALSALLEDEKSYSHEDVAKILKKFLEQGVR